MLKRNGAKDAHVVEAQVSKIIAIRTVVMHGGKHDMTAFETAKDEMFKTSTVVDTQELYSYLQKDRTPGLATTAREILGLDIQQGSHSSVEDAQTTMKLYQKLVPFDRETAQKKLEDAQPRFVQVGQAFGKRGPIMPAWVNATKAEGVVKGSIEVFTSEIASTEDFPALGAPVKKKRADR